MASPAPPGPQVDESPPPSAGPASGAAHSFGRQPLRQALALTPKVGALLKVVFTTAIGLTAILTLVFIVWPELRPTPPSPPSSLHATLADAKLEQGVTLGEYAARRGLRLPPSYDAADRQRLGLVISLNVTIAGYQGQPCRLTWTVFDASTQRAVAEAWLRDQPGWPDGVITATALVDQVNARLWVPVVPQSGRYFLRVTITDPKGVELASLDTATFPGGEGDLIEATHASAPQVVPTRQPTAPPPFGEESRRRR